MYTITQRFHLNFGHRLLNYPGKCQNLHGHTARVEIDIAAEDLDTAGMVQDLCTVKKILGEWIDESLDHKMILSEADPLLPILKERGEVCFIIAGNPTMETLCRLIHEKALEKGLKVSEVRLWESENSFAAYHP